MFSNLKKAKHHFKLATEGFIKMPWSARAGLVLAGLAALAVMVACYLLPLHFVQQYALASDRDTFKFGALAGSVVFSIVGPLLSGLFVKAVGKLADMAAKACGE